MIDTRRCAGDPSVLRGLSQIGPKPRSSLAKIEGRYVQQESALHRCAGAAFASCSVERAKAALSGYLAEGSRGCRLKQSIGGYICCFQLFRLRAQSLARLSQGTYATQADRHVGSVLYHRPVFVVAPVDQRAGRNLLKVVRERFAAKWEEVGTTQLRCRVWYNKLH
ncbi:hypothetical protein BDZ89DRAFT_1194234 [Hymenopellis radicata]|nr:hypothetical protein BDZ89DRAFT_1194234 [Hymenopellis radicata]